MIVVAAYLENHLIELTSNLILNPIEASTADKQD